jgi:hypothetical protein
LIDSLRGRGRGKGKGKEKGKGQGGRERGEKGGRRDQPTTKEGKGFKIR